MSKLKNLTGTPWHVDKFSRSEGDERRHRSRCIYYRKDDSYCCKEIMRCMGAAHCENYKERIKEGNDKKIHLSAKVGTQIKDYSISKKVFPIGARVRHIKFGTGKIINNDGMIVTVKFDKGQDKPLRFDAKKYHDKTLLVQEFYDPEKYDF